MLKSIFIQASACQRCPPWVSMVFRQGLMIISMTMLTMVVESDDDVYNVYIYIYMYTHLQWCLDQLLLRRWPLSDVHPRHPLHHRRQRVHDFQNLAGDLKRGSERVSINYFYLYLYLHLFLYLRLYLYLNLYVPTRLAPTGPSPSETIWILLHLDRGVLTSAATEGST